MVRLAIGDEERNKGKEDHEEKKKRTKQENKEHIQNEIMTLFVSMLLESVFCFWFKKVF
jgi:hypothetical protein